MRLLPNTLFGRLVLVLVGGLLAAQLVSGLILLKDRGSALFEASRHHSAQRIAGIVRALEALPAEQRPTLLKAISGPTLRVTPTQAPTKADSNHPLARRIKTMISRRLGDDHPVWLRIQLPTNSTKAALDPPARRPGPPQGPPPGWSGPDPRFSAPFGANFSQGPGWSEQAPYADRYDQRRQWQRFRSKLAGMRLEARVQLVDGTWIRFINRSPAGSADLPKQALGAILVLLIAVIALALFSVRRLTRPLTMLAGAADELGRDIHRPPLDESGPQEVQQAARAFNTMQRRIGRYIKDREQMLAAVSHDLKTPITRLRLRAELVDDPAFQAKVAQDLDDMETMVNATLDFMRGADTQEPRQALDLAALLGSIEADQQELGHPITVTGAAAPYPARPLALKRCLSNLIENAIRYGGSASVQLSDTPEQVSINILDDGPGIPEARLEQVFDPFVRLEGSRNKATGGTGLGLSIARSIARAHGGDLTLINRPQEGLKATLTLPR